LIIDVFTLLPGAREIDRDNLVASIDVPGRQVTIFQENRGRIVRELFENDFSAFKYEPDGTVEFQAWSNQAIEQILNEELPAFSLRGVVR
jgi:hypothetical protein